MITERERISFFKNIGKLKVSSVDKKRMLKLMQVRGSNKKNKVMSFKELQTHLEKSQGKITSLTLGPSWNRLVFVDINVEVT